MFLNLIPEDETPNNFYLTRWISVPNSRALEYSSTEILVHIWFRLGHTAHTDSYVVVLFNFEHQWKGNNFLLALHVFDVGVSLRKPTLSL